jgi:hypothetical protein
MTREGRAASALGRIGPPVLRLLLVTVAAGVAYHAAWRIPIRAAHQAVSAVAIAVYFGGLGFGTLYVWIACARRGASPGERALACAIVPFLWMTKEVIRVGAFWPLPDALFFYLNPLHVTMACVTIQEMGLAEMILRRRRRSRGEAVRCSRRGPGRSAAAAHVCCLHRPARALAAFFVS